MSYRFLLFLSLFLLSQATDTLIFSDDFDTLNPKTWRHEITLGGGGNWEFEYYTNNRSNSYVKNGILYIKPTLLSDAIGDAKVRGGYTMDIWGSGDPASVCTGNGFYGCSRTSGAPNYLNPIQSARLRTAESFSFKYGRVEVRAKLPRGDWLWPAIWMLPRYGAYGTWPASGEIDIMESRGNLNYPTANGGGCGSMGSTLHWGPDFFTNRFKLTHKQYDLPSGTFNDEFHVFGLFWDETKLYTYIDTDTNRVLEVDITQSFWDKGQFSTNYDNPWFNVSKAAPFDQEFYLIFNVAVGGTADYWTEGVAGKPWSNTATNSVNQFYDNKGQWYPTWAGEDSALQIDYVKVWQDPSKGSFTRLEGMAPAANSASSGFLIN